MDPKWETKKRILVILAHPDDPEFFCGATIAKWTGEGHEVNYCLLTKGDKGFNEQFKIKTEIIRTRIKEQKRAAAILGVHNITFLNNEDGYLIPDLLLRKEITGVIRKIKPDIVVTCDPTNYFIRDTYINHPDHRAAGQSTIDAVFPAVQNAYFFPDLIENKNLTPHYVEEVWLSLPNHPNTIMNVTKFWEKKISALLEHQSQIGDREEFIKRMNDRYAEDSDEKPPRYEELFRRIVFQRR